MTRALSTLLLSLLLSACCASRPVKVHHWTKDEEAKMADAVDGLPDDSPLIPALEEWAGLRCQLDPTVCGK